MPRESDGTPTLPDLQARVVSLESALRDAEAVEQQLRESEERLARVFRGADDGWWDCNLTTGEVYFSPRWWEIHGYRPGELPSTQAIWKALAHVDDQPDVQHAYEQSIESASGRFEVESRRLHKDGHWVPVLTRGYVTRDSAGHPLRASGTTTDLTEKKRTEDALRKSEERFRTMVETTNVGVWAIDRDGRTEFVNRQMAEILGYEPAEMVGRPAVEFVFEGDLTEHHKSTDRRRAGERETYERRFVRKDGRVVWALVSATPSLPRDGMYAGAFATLVDITARKQAEEKLRAMVQLLDASPDSITVHDSSGHFYYANRRSFELHGYNEHEFMALNLHDLDIPESAALIEERVQRIVEDGQATFEVRHVRKDGSELPLQVYARQIVWAGIPALLSVATDLTERKKAESELSRQVDELRRWYEATLGREARIAELKREVNALAERLNLPKPYAQEDASRTTPT